MKFGKDSSTSDTANIGNKYNTIIDQYNNSFDNVNTATSIFHSTEVALAYIQNS
jgi:hypothetical protein